MTKQNRRDFLGTIIKSAVAGSVAAIGTPSAFGQAPPKNVLVGNKSVIQPSDLTYLGGWVTPYTGVAASSVNDYSMAAIAVRYVGAKASLADRRFLMIEFDGNTGTPVNDIVELGPPTTLTPYRASVVAADLSVDMSSAPQMVVKRRWSAADWIDTSWINSTFFYGNYHVASLYWDDVNGLLWMSFCAYYGTGCNLPVWYAVELLDTVKQTVNGVSYCTVGRRFGPWYYNSATKASSDWQLSPYYRSVNQFIIPVPASGRNYVGGNKFLMTAGHQGYNGDGSMGPSLHVVSDLTPAMANPVPHLKAVTQYHKSLSPLSIPGIRRPSTDYFYTEPENLPTTPAALGEGWWGTASPGQGLLGAAWVDTGTKHGLIFLGWEGYGGVGYWTWNPKGTVNSAGATNPAAELPFANCRDTTERLWSYQSGRDDVHSPKCEHYRLQVRIFNPAHFAEVYADTRCPYADTYGGKPGMRLAYSSDVRSSIIDGATVPYADSSMLMTGGDGPATAVTIGRYQTDTNNAVWDEKAGQIVWARYKAGPGGRHVFCFFSVR